MNRFLLCLFVLFSGRLVAEETTMDDHNQPPKSLFGNAKDCKIGGYGAPVIKVSQLGSGVGTTIGGRGAIIINRMVSIGAAGYGLVGHSNLSLGDNNSGVSMGYGGPGVGIKLFTDEIVYIDMFNLFGFGGLALKNKSKKGAIFVIEPEVNVEVNLLPFLQLGLGINYRFAFSGSGLAIKSTDLFGFGGQAYVQFSKM